MEPSLAAGLPMLVQYRWPASVSTTMPSGRRRPSLTRTLRLEPSGFVEKTSPLLALRKNNWAVVASTAGLLIFDLEVLTGMSFPSLLYYFGYGYPCRVRNCEFNSATQRR